MDTLYPEICQKYFKEARVRHVTNDLEVVAYGEDIEKETERLIRDKIAHFISRQDVVDMERKEDRGEVSFTGTVYVMNPRQLRSFVTAIVKETMERTLCWGSKGE